MVKFYSTRSNAVRAAKTANILDFEITEVAHPTVAGAKQYAWRETTPAQVVDTTPAQVDAPAQVETPTAQKKPRNGAVATAWGIFAANPGIARKDAIQMAVDAGVNYYTARTQFQQYFKALNG